MSEEMLEELKTIKKLLVVQLLNAGVTPEVIGKLLGTKAKTIQNQFPIGKIKSK